MALATPTLSFFNVDGPYAALEGRSMLAGTVAFFVGSLVVGRTLLARKGRAPLSALLAAGAAYLAWLVAAAGAWALFERFRGPNQGRSVRGQELAQGVEDVEDVEDVGL